MIVQRADLYWREASLTLRENTKSLLRAFKAMNAGRISGPKRRKVT
jgi:hypothetical protein